MVGYLLRRTRDPELAEELAQETFYRATRAFLGWRGGSAAGWLLAIARNALIDHVRKSHRIVALDDAMNSEAPSFEASLDVRLLLDALAPQQRRLIELVYLEGFSIAEVAAMAGASPGSVKTALWRARNALRMIAAQEGGIDDPR